ncbi:MAG: reverse transcriptase domain-containing protein [Deltaproteobacteria bacterium]
MRIHLPKYGTTETRPIDIPTILDQARLYPLQDWLSEYAEPLLCKRAVAFRRWTRTDGIIKGVARLIVEKGYHWGAVVDVENFFGSLKWSMVDALIESLPSDKAVQRLLKDLVRVQVVDRAERAPVPRQARGIPQGLSVSPTLANLYLAEWDRHVNQALSYLEAMVIRYCDDLLVLAQTRVGAERSVEIVRDRLRHRGLKAKPGQGEVVDLTAGAVRWLKLDFSVGGIEVARDVLQWKIYGYHHKAACGLFTADGLEQSIIGLTTYYEKILPAPRASEVTGAIREGTRDLFDSLHAPPDSNASPHPTERRFPST